MRMLAECITKGGNLLVSAGPTPEGEIPPEQEELLLALGEWTGKYAEAIYPTKKVCPANILRVAQQFQKTIELYICSLMISRRISFCLMVSAQKSAKLPPLKTEKSFRMSTSAVHRG